MRPILLVAALTACGTASAGSGEPTFEIRYIDIGHPSTSVLVLDHDGDGALDLLVSGGESGSRSTCHRIRTPWPSRTSTKTDCWTSWWMTAIGSG